MRSDYGRTINDLLLLKGDIAGRSAAAIGQARAREQEILGQLWGQAINNVGQIAASVPQQLQERRRLKLQEDAQRQQLQERQALTAQRERGVQDDAALDQAFSPAAALGPQGVGPMPEHAPAPTRDQILNAVPPHLRGRVEERFAKADQHAEQARTSRQKARADAIDYAGYLGLQVAEANYDPTIANAVLDHATEGEDDQETLKQIAQMRAAFRRDPSLIRQVTDGAIRASKYKDALAPAKTREVRTRNADGSERVQIVEDKPGLDLTSALPPEKPKEYAVTVPGPTGPVKKLVPADQLRAGVQEYREPKPAPDTTDVTPDAIDLAALNYKKTGVMPPLGNGDKHTRQAILNRAATLTPEDAALIEAGGRDIAANKSDYQANTKSLESMQKQRDAIGAFEQTASKNIDVFLASAGKVVDTGSPLANGLARAVTGRVLGSPDQAAYDAARQVAINEIAKITSNPTLSGTLSDSARHEVEAFNPASATLAQTVKVMRLLKQDMQNRTTALDEQIGAIRGRLGGGGQTPSAGTVRMRAPNGQERDVPAAQVEHYKQLGAVVVR